MEEPTWLDRALLEVLHTDQTLEHGGSLGIRDEGLLESALARPAYAYGIAKNHPFIDGNKRAALVALYTFLAINGFELEAPEPEAVSVMVGTADGSLSEDDLAS